MNQPFRSTTTSVATLLEKHAVPVADNGVITAFARSLAAWKFTFITSLFEPHGLTVIHPSPGDIDDVTFIDTAPTPLALYQAPRSRWLHR